MPSYQRLKTMVRHIDQMIRMRNFKARKERIETGVLVKSHLGRKVSVEREVGECYQRGQQLDSVQEETLVVSAMEPIAHKKHNCADTD